MVSLPTDFESVTSTNSITPASFFLLYKLFPKNSRGTFQESSKFWTPLPCPLDNYRSYYRRKSCVFLLHTLSIFDMLWKKTKQKWKFYPNSFDPIFSFSRGFPAFFCRRLKKPLVSGEIYIKRFIKIFYKELFTLSTEFSTGWFPGKWATASPICGRWRIEEKF